MSPDRLAKLKPGQAKLRDRVNSKNELTVHLLPPLPVLSPDSKQTSTVTELAEKADAVVIANVISKSAQITTSGTFVFTDYQLNVEEVLRADSDKLKPQTPSHDQAERFYSKVKS